MILFDARQIKWISDKTFERLDLKSGIPDIYSAARKSVDGTERADGPRFSTGVNCPLTTRFARDVSDPGWPEG
jgi:hypothetical protein